MRMSNSLCFLLKAAVLDIGIPENLSLKSQTQHSVSCFLFIHKRLYVSLLLSTCLEGSGISDLLKVDTLS